MKFMPSGGIYEQNTGQELHTHLGSIERRNEFAGVIFLDGCEETDLIFMNPSSQNLYFIDKQLYRKMFNLFIMNTYQPKNNQLIIFPCTLQHYVSTHKCLEPRMTIHSTFVSRLNNLFERTNPV